MPEKKPPFPLLLLSLLSIVSAATISPVSIILTASGDAAVKEPRPASSPTTTDKEVLLNLKSFLLENNHIHRGRYADWNESAPSPCSWLGITCNANGSVAAIDLHGSGIAGGIFHNFSRLPGLARLDLSNNTIIGSVPPDLSQCRSLRHLNLSHNLIAGELNLAALILLETLDVSVNRLEGSPFSSFPADCGKLVSVNISSNNFTGEIGDYFNGCRRRLKYLDLSLNRFEGEIWRGFWWLREFSASDNFLRGVILPETFPANCNLEALDLSANALSGKFPDSIANCSKLTSLNLWGNFFTGRIPAGMGSLAELDSLFLGNNSFEKNLPLELLDCRKLVFLDLSRNPFGGQIQPIFGKLASLKFLILHSNSYVGGIEESGVLKLPNLLRLDLSFNNFSRELPATAVDMPEIKLLILAHNDFYGRIPKEYGRISTLQALDLSFNRLSGGVPPEIGRLTSLLWLMLANNELTGEIPPEIGNCSSLLWLNLANNGLSGRIPPAISGTGWNPAPTFTANRWSGDLTAGSSECLTLKRWMPATYPPFSFIYTGMTRQGCRDTWDQLLKGSGVFPVCLNSSRPIRTLDSSGYIQLSGNRLSAELPPAIGRMRRLSLIHLDDNKLSGGLPPGIGSLPLIVLTVSGNQFSGQIPEELGRLQCLQSLDLSRNNFSGMFPASLNSLSNLNNFNVSFNPFLYGVIPSSGQIATFDNKSFIGNPLISFSTAVISLLPFGPPKGGGHQSMGDNEISFRLFTALITPILIFGVAFFFFLCLMSRSRSVIKPLPGSDPDPIFPNSETLILDGEAMNELQIEAMPSPSPPTTTTRGSSFSSPRSSSRSSFVNVFGIERMAFTYPDILKATRNFSSMVIGHGGCGEVYQGVLPDGRLVAIKKLQRGGAEGERAFRAEMEVLSGGHPNLVMLYGWCLAGSKKLLVYEYMEGGCLEDVIKDRHGFGWARRLETAVGVARALMYLHHVCVPAVVHRDVKASNVLMDGEGVARVTDFGLARVMVDGKSHVSTVVAGTVGYVAPEYGQTWRATTKGDVYSFGVLAMELATGRRAVEDEGEECLVDWLRRVGAQAAVAAMEEWGEDGGEALKGLLRVGMSCAVEVPQARPNMKEVLELLLCILREGSSTQPCIA